MWFRGQIFYYLLFWFVGWFSGLFGGETTTKAPSVTTTTLSPLLPIGLNGLQSPAQWLTMLAHHIATTKPPPIKKETPKRAKYDDYQVWRVAPSTQAHVDYLREYKASSDGEKIHWLKGPAMRYLMFGYKLHFSWIGNSFEIFLFSAEVQRIS